jgi:hypothetical protein
MIEMRFKDELVGFYPDLAAARVALAHMPYTPEQRAQLSIAQRATDEPSS